LPNAIDADNGLTAIDTSVGGVTVSVAEPLIVPDVAVMVVLPWLLLVASPEELMVATEVAEDVQETDVVRFFVVPSV
jgi:hypothetical protein